MTSPWGTPKEPQAGDRYREADAWNRRLLLRPTEYIPDIKKLDTRGDALKLNVVDLDNEGGPKLYTGILWFSGPLIAVFKESLGTPFVGYITKEKNTNGYMAWKFYDLQTDPDTDARAQAYLREHPEFLAPLQQVSAQAYNPTGHHENGPAPEWAGAVPAAPQRPAGPPAPPAPPRVPQAPPAPAGGYGGPPAPPVSGPPAGDPSDVMERLRRQAGIAPGTGANVGSGEEPPF